MTKPIPGSESVKAPAGFTFFPDDFLGGTQGMTAAAVGVYIRLLCYQFPRGSFPPDHGAMARAGQVTPREFARVWPEIESKFAVLPDGNLQNAALERHRSFLLKQRANGLLGGRPRNPNHNPDETQTVTQTVTQTEPPNPNPNPRDQNHNRGRGRGVPAGPSLPGMDRPKKARAKPVGEHPALIAWFIETWQAVHPGATYVVTPKDGVAAAALLKAAGVEEIRRRIGEMFRAKWLGPSLTLSKASGAWNDFAPGYEKPPASGFKAPTAKQIEDLRMGLLDPVQRGQALRWAKDFCGMDERAAIACAGLETT